MKLKNVRGIVVADLGFNDSGTPSTYLASADILKVFGADVGAYLDVLSREQHEDVAWLNWYKIECEVSNYVRKNCLLIGD